MLADSVLHRVLVEAELVGEFAQQVVIGRADIGPHQAIGLFEVVRNLFEWEVLRLERAAAPHPRAYLVGAHVSSVPLWTGNLRIRG